MPIKFKLSLTKNPVFESITGLLNKTWDKTNFTTGRAATEDQLAALAASIETDTNTITTVAQGTNIVVSDAGTEGNHAYTVTTADTITGLTNTTWSGTATSGRAATEDQLASAIADAETHHSVVAKGTGIDSIGTATVDGTTTYTVNATEYEVVSVDSNLIVEVDDGTTPTP